MSSDVVKFAFIAGEISPTLFGRSDLTKYDLGMAEAHNFFVDYRGGLSSRPGFEFIDLKAEMERFFGRRVDLLTRRAVEASKNPYRRREILGGAETVHAA